MLVRTVSGYSRTRRQHHAQWAGDTAGHTAGEYCHIQPTRWALLIVISIDIVPLVLIWSPLNFFCSTETGLEQRHMAFCGLFSDALTLLNGVGVSTGEALAAHIITWLDKKVRGFPILPLLTACSCRLASVRHMTRIMEACITAYFNHGKQLLLFSEAVVSNSHSVIIIWIL